LANRESTPTSGKGELSGREDEVLGKGRPLSKRREEQGDTRTGMGSTPKKKKKNIGRKQSHEMGKMGQKIKMREGTSSTEAAQYWVTANEKKTKGGLQKKKAGGGGAKKLKKNNLAAGAVCPQN